jgi:hypothetical protein
MRKCPKCLKPAFDFERKIYIVDSNNDYVISTLHGCDKCNIIFTFDNIISTTELLPEKKKTDSEKNMDRFQKMLGGLSKGCTKVLENIK